MENFFNKRYYLASGSMSVTSALIMFKQQDNFIFRKSYLKVVHATAMGKYVAHFHVKDVTVRHHTTAAAFISETNAVLQRINGIQDLHGIAELGEIPPLSSRSSIEGTDWALNLQHYLEFIRSFSELWITEDDIPHIERIINLSDPGGKIFLECINESIY